MMKSEQQFWDGISIRVLRCQEHISWIRWCVHTYTGSIMKKTKITIWLTYNSLNGCILTSNSLDWCACMCSVCFETKWSDPHALLSKIQVNEDLNNQINSNNQDDKNSNNSLSTQTTIIIICVHYYTFSQFVYLFIFV